MAIVDTDKAKMAAKMCDFFIGAFPFLVRATPCLQGSYGCYLYEITQKGELWAISDERPDAFHSMEILARFML